MLHVIAAGAGAAQMERGGGKINSQTTTACTL